MSRDQTHNLHSLLGALRTVNAVRRGDVKPAVLAMLKESPMHGYQLMRELETRTGGRWRPSAGSVYPTLQQLEDEGLVTASEQEGRRVYTLTDKGRKVAGRFSHLEHSWLGTHGRDAEPNLRRQAIQLLAAAAQVEKFGSEEARTKAREVLSESRKQLYALLAEDER